MFRPALLLAVAALALPLGAQTPMQTDPGLKALLDNWKGAIANVTAAAKEMTEADFAYRPVATVRTFGEIVGHVAGSQDMFCAAALGEPVPAEDAVEKAATSKAALVAALEASSRHCERAYAISVSAGAAPIELFGQKVNKMYALTLNAVHVGEHYGNIVTYMRMKNMVPPSSKR